MSEIKEALLDAGFSRKAVKDFLVKEKDFLDEYGQALSEGRWIDKYDSLEALGEDNRDNECFDKNDEAYDIGEFLVRACQQGNSSGTFYYQMSDGTCFSL